MEHDAIIKFAKEAAVAAFEIRDADWMPSADDAYIFMRDVIWGSDDHAYAQSAYAEVELTEQEMHTFRSAFASEVERLREEAARG